MLGRSSRAVVALALVVACIAAMVVASPRPPSITLSTATGVVATGGPAGLLNELPFTLRVDPSNERFRLDLVYYFQTITIMQNQGELYIKVGEECESDVADDFLLRSDLFADADFIETTMISTQYFRNASVNHFSGQLGPPDDDYGYGYGYGYDERSESYEEEYGYDDDDGGLFDDVSYDLYAKTTDTNFIVRLILYSYAGVPGSFVDFRNFDHKALPASTWNIRCFKRSISKEHRPLIRNARRLLSMLGPKAKVAAEDVAEVQVE